jgi:hypothetical protein
MTVGLGTARGCTSVTYYPDFSEMHRFCLVFGFILCCGAWVEPAGAGAVERVILADGRATTSWAVSHKKRSRHSRTPTHGHTAKKTEMSPETKRRLDELFLLDALRNAGRH